MPHFRHDPLRLRDAVRATLVGAGLSETVTHALVSPAMVERFPRLGEVVVAGEGEPDGAPIAVSNPLSSQHAVMRQSLLGSLLEVVATNVRHGRDAVAVFEVGKGYGRLEVDRTHEWWRLAFALTGPAEPPAWDRPAHAYDLGDAKGLVELIAHRLGLRAVDYRPVTDAPNLHPGRTALARAGDDLVALVGELHPATIEALDIRAERVIVAEMAIAGLSGGAPFVPRAGAPSRHPAVARDLAVVVPESTPASAVAAALAGHAGPLLGEATLFDIYRGRPLDDEHKSLAYRLTFLAPDRTLTEDEIDGIVATIRDGLAADVDGRIRT